MSLIPGTPSVQARTPFELFWHRFREDRLALASLVFLGLLIVVAIFAPLVVELCRGPGPERPRPIALDVFGTPTGPQRPLRSASTSSGATSSAAPSTEPGSR